jgi:hypothetical protein
MMKGILYFDAILFLGYRIEFWTLLISEFLMKMTCAFGWIIGFDLLHSLSCSLKLISNRTVKNGQYVDKFTFFNDISSVRSKKLAWCLSKCFQFPIMTITFVGYPSAIFDRFANGISRIIKKKILSWTGVIPAWS